VPAPFAELCHPLAGGLPTPARGEGTLRGRFTGVLGLARNPIRSDLSALLVVIFVYCHLADHKKGAHRCAIVASATMALAGVGAIGAIAQAESGNYASSR